jgi:predicted metal-binding protein
MAKKIGIIYCKRIQDQSCIGCAKCYKAASDKAFAFEGEDDIQIVFKTGCGDCPGLVLPKLQLQMGVLEKLDAKVDEMYFGTCVKKAAAVMNCPMNIEVVQGKMEEMFDVPVTIGTHDYA